jgi:hypothetical protein
VHSERFAMARAVRRQLTLRFVVVFAIIVVLTCVG